MLNKNATKQNNINYYLSEDLTSSIANQMSKQLDSSAKEITVLLAVSNRIKALRYVAAKFIR